MDDDQHARDPEERRWLLLLHLLFAVALAVPVVVTLVEWPDGAVVTLAIAAGFGAWYAAMFAWQHARRSSRDLLVYAVGAVLFSTVLVLRDGTWLLLLYALLPQLFSSLPRRRAVAAVAALVLAPPLVRREVTTDDAITLVAVLGLGLVVTAIVETLDRRNREQKDTIAALEAARAENERLADQAAAQGRAAGVLAERQRLAHDIHDTLAQGFTSIVTQLEAAEQALAGDPDVATRHLALAKRTAREGLTEARRTVEALRPTPLVDAELPAALQALVSRWREEHAGRATVHVDGAARRLDPAVETALLRVAQEALTNVARHAAATEVTVTVSYLDDVVLLDVQDDGRGFTPREAAGRFGLTSMRERVALVGGELAVEGVPGEGTTVVVRVPVDGPPPRADAGPGVDPAVVGRRGAGSVGESSATDATDAAARSVEVAGGR